ncbi:unnamed protein product [Periconia digitata]|uniref:Uncharacterized protein n=1 Tax=Periconia digitata TaxID=1303443 RepID=A0A9W4UNG0_9PLEO|nr:unnamed protein product [Periconia digitata]
MDWRRNVEGGPRARTFGTNLAATGLSVSGAMHAYLRAHPRIPSICVDGGGGETVGPSVCGIRTVCCPRIYHQIPFSSTYDNLSKPACAVMSSLLLHVNLLSVHHLHPTPVQMLHYAPQSVAF